MLSNSDPRNGNYQDTFFDDLFAGYTIGRVPARRMINCNGTRRGSIDELIITNYPDKEKISGSDYRLQQRCVVINMFTDPVAKVVDEDLL